MCKPILGRDTCTGKWDLSENPADYLHSSAKLYILGEQGIYPVNDYSEVIEIDLGIAINDE